MLLIGLALLVIAWTGSAVVALALCAVAAEGDRTLAAEQAVRLRASEL